MDNTTPAGPTTVQNDAGRQNIQIRCYGGRSMVRKLFVSFDFYVSSLEIGSRLIAHFPNLLTSFGIELLKLIIWPLNHALRSVITSNLAFLSIFKTRSEIQNNC